MDSWKLAPHKSDMQSSRESDAPTHKWKSKKDWAGKIKRTLQKEDTGGVSSRGHCSWDSFHNQPVPCQFHAQQPTGKGGSLRQCKDARVQLVSVTDGVQQRTRRCFYISIWSITSCLQRSKQPEQEACLVAPESHFRSNLFIWSVGLCLQSVWAMIKTSLFFFFLSTLLQAASCQYHNVE